MNAYESRRFAFREGLQLRVTGRRPVLKHFEAEYRSAATREDDSRPDVHVRFEPRPSGVHARALIRGRHKTARWAVALAAPDESPLTLWIALDGRPLSFGLSLVQGYFVEPVLSVAAARGGDVLLPAAGLADEQGATILLGRSRSGKSSVSVRALAAGKPTLGDDQILLDGIGRCRPFPRRLRFYADLPQTAPSAYARLRPATRGALRSLQLFRELTRGYVAPPIRVPATELGAYAHGPHPTTRVFLIERAVAVEQLTITAADTETAVEFALTLLDEQRARLREHIGSDWALELRDARESEERTLHSAFEGIPVRHIAVPKSWNAVRAIDALAELLVEEPFRAEPGATR